MLKERLMEQINNENHYTISNYVLLYAKKENLSLNAFILLIYFLNKKNKDIFDYNKVLKDLNFNGNDLLDAVSVLKEKKILSITMEKNDSGILEEKVDISSFYDIIFSKLIDNIGEKEKSTDIFSTFEKEFGRTLSPIEYEILNSWLESKIPEEIILEALKEAVYNGVNNFRYIDKILFEWNKKGIKRAEDIRILNKKEEESKEENCYDYDWLSE